MKAAFWTALIAGILCVVAVLIIPTPAILFACIFFALARAIGRHQRWAAIAAAWFVLFPLPIILMRDGNPPEAYRAIPFYLVAGVAFIRGALDKGDRDSFVPWAGLIVATTIFWCTMRLFAIPTGAMEPTLLRGDNLVASTRASTPARGQILIFRYPIDPHQTFVKRVVGIPGDRLRINRKRVYLNGQLHLEPYAVHSTDYEDPYRDNFPSQPNTMLYPPAVEMLNRNVTAGEVVVPQGKYFVMGDNRDMSLDSRYWGFVSSSDIVGKPLMIYGSYENADPKGEPSIFNFRWNRVFKLL